MASIDQTVQLTEQLEKQNKLYAAQGQMLKGQLAIMKQMQDIFNGMNNGQNGQELDEITEKAGNAGAELEAFGSKSQKTMNALTNSMKKATMDSGKFGGTIDKMAKKGPAIAILALAFDGMTEGIKFSMNAMTSLGSIAGTVIGSLTNLGFAIVTLPFKMLQGLINMTDGGGGSGLREALEAIRGEFGALKTGASEAIIDVSRGMKGELAETGLSSYRIFGNLAERLKTVTEYAKNMGNAFDLVRKSFVENGERIGAYIKGLGLGEEGQRALAQTAIRMGTSLQEVGREITTFAYGMGEAFGINGRQISGDVGKMMDDFENFGNLGVQTLTNISVYARKLGVEFKDLQGVIGKFDNFEEAAQGAAQLQQAFGLQLDTLQLINAQDPAERIEMLRKSFFDAGRSIENMTRQERALLATQTGLDQKTASLVFSMESQGQSYADIQKASDTTKKKQLSQAEAMEKLSDSIQRLVKSGGSGSGGFFDRFLQGFSKGIRKSAEFRDLMRSLRQSLLVVHRAGIQVGRAFVDAFPGVREMIKGLADFFDPGRFRKAMRGTVDIFKKFFKGDLNLDGFQKELKKNFSDFFDIDSPAGQKFKAGVKKFFFKIRDLFVEGVRIGMNALKNGADFLVQLIQNPSKALAAASNAGNSIGGFVMTEVFQPIFQTLTGPGGQALMSSLGTLFSVAFEFMVKKITELAIQYREPIAKAFITIFVAPAMISSISRGLIGGVGVAVAKGLSGALKKGITALRQGQASAAQAGGGALGGTGSGGVGADVLGGRQGNMISRSIDGLGEILESARNINLGGVRKLFDIGVGFAVFGAGVIVALAGLVWLVAAVNLSVVDIAKTVFVMSAALAVGTALGLAVKGLQAIGASAGMVKEAAIGFAAIAVTGLAVIGGLWGLSQAAKVLDAGDVMVVSGVMLATIPIVLALAAIMAVLTGTGMLAVATSGVAVVGFVALAATVVGAGELARESVDAFSGTVVQQVIDTGLKISAITYVVAGLSAILTVLTGSGILGAMGVLGIIGGVALTSTITGAAALTQKAITGFSDINITQVQAAGEKIKSIAFIIGGLAVVGASLLVAGVSAGLQKVADWLGIGGTAITDLVERMEGTTKSIIDAANRLNITDAELASINKIKTIIEVIGSFAEVYSKLASAAGPSLAGAAVNGESLGQNLLVIGSVVNLLPIQISAVVNSLKGIASTVSEEDVKKIGMVGEILTHVGNFVGSIISAATSFPQTGEAALGRNLKKITNFLKNIGPSIGEIFSSIGTSIIDVVSSSGFNIKSFTAATQGFSSILGTLGTFVTNMLKASTEGTGGSGATQAAAAYISSTVESITGAFSGNAIKGQLTRLMDTVGELGQGMSASKLKGIERFGTGLASISEAMSTIAQNSDHITGESMLRVQTSVAAMVHGIKEIGESIKSLKGININSELRGLASRLGLESREQLRIEHGNLNITINLKVQVDAEELERVLLNREGRQFMSKTDTGH